MCIVDVYTCVYQLSFQNWALVISLFVWCMSGGPCAFEGKICTHNELIHVVYHVWLTVNCMCARDEFARVVHV